MHLRDLELMPMNKVHLKKKTDAVVNETKDALQIVYDSLNQGQQKKILKNDEVAQLFERYQVNI